MGIRNEAKQTHWKKTLAAILAVCGHEAAIKDKWVGGETQGKRGDTLYAAFSTLRDLGFKVENPFRFGPKHLTTLIKYWQVRELSVATIQNRLSILRVFCHWIDKTDLVDVCITAMGEEAPGNRTYVALHDKSWSGNGIEPEEVARRVSRINILYGTWIRLSDAFGLRIKEALLLDPRQLHHGSLVVARGTKGGRLRYVPVTSVLQEQVLQEARRVFEANGGSLCVPGSTLKGARDSFYEVLANEGISRETSGLTFHGLRAGYVCRRMEEMDITPAVRSADGKASGMELEKLTKIVEEVGHSDIYKLAAYGGGIILTPKK